MNDFCFVRTGWRRWQRCRKNTAATPDFELAGGGNTHKTDRMLFVKAPAPRLRL